MKRAVDIALSGAALLISAPVLGVLAAAVKLESRGPALYFQTRVGKGKRPIRVAKLRTMVVDAEKLGPSITAERDPRITRVGRFLRRTKLDELPQLWNVLRGDMSIVGPRPEVPRYVDRYRPEWQPLLTVRPGLTDLASVVFRDEERLLARARDRERAYAEVVMPMKLELALESIAGSSVLADLVILARTAAAVLHVRDPRGDAIVQEAVRRIEQLNEAP